MKQETRRARPPIPDGESFWAKARTAKAMVIAYFIMGRSVNSRNRVFIAEGEGSKPKPLTRAG